MEFVEVFTQSEREFNKIVDIFKEYNHIPLANKGVLLFRNYKTKKGISIKQRISIYKPGEKLSSTNYFRKKTTLFAPFDYEIGYNHVNSDINRFFFDDNWLENFDKSTEYYVMRNTSIIEGIITYEDISKKDFIREKSDLKSNIEIISEEYKDNRARLELRAYIYDNSPTLIKGFTNINSAISFIKQGVLKKVNNYTEIKYPFQFLNNLIHDKDIDENKRLILKEVLTNFKSNKAYFYDEKDKKKVMKEWGILEEIVKTGFGKGKKDFNGLLGKIYEKMLSPDNPEYNDVLKGLVLFGSLYRGNYVNSVEPLKDLDDDFVVKTILYDLFNYPFGSDIDLCFIVDDSFYEKDDEEIKEVLGSFLLDSDYYIEHVSIINKRVFHEVLSNFHKYETGFKDAPVDIKFLKFEHDYYPKSLRDNARRDLEQRRVEWNIKIQELKKELENMKIKESDSIRKQIIEYSLNRLNQGITNEDSFGHKQIMKALNHSFFISSDEMLNYYIRQLNFYNLVSKKYSEIFKNFNYERAKNDMINNNRLNKWHFLKYLRWYFLNNYKKRLEK
jgi:hypothetical protein